MRWVARHIVSKKIIFLGFANEEGSLASWGERTKTTCEAAGSLRQACQGKNMLFQLAKQILRQPIS
jgi:hypothetical protein